MMKTKQENDLTNHTGIAYAENDNELSWLIGLGADVDPAFFTMRSHLMVWLAFNLFSENMTFKKDLESPLIFVLFLREKKKKENPKCESLFAKDSLWKTKVGSKWT